MPNNIPFSLGLEGLSTDILALSGNGGFPQSMIGSAIGDMYNSGASGAFGGGVDVTLGAVSLDGYFNTDNNLKQLVCPMTLFQSFPVETSDGSYTRVTDYTSTTDKAGTNLGHCVQNLNSGKCGYPDNATASVLDMQTNGGVKNFKVGAGIALPYIENWFKRFFPEVTFKASRKYTNVYGGAFTGGSMYDLIADGCLCAEVVFPTSNTSGKAIRIKLVSFGPMHEGPRFDVMPAFCLAKGNAEVFKITALSKGRNTVVDGTNLKFMFADCPYDWKKGEVIGYGPATLKQKLYGPGGKSFDQSKVWRGYTGGTVGGPTGINGFSVVRVRFFIEPGHKEKAEKILKCSIPDELLKTNYEEGTMELPNVSVANSQMANVDNSSIAGMIVNAGLKVGNYCVSRGLTYNQGMRAPKAAPAGDKSGMKVIAKATDCSAGVWWILSEAGIINPKYYSSAQGTVSWRNKKSIAGYLNSSYDMVQVDINNIQAGDIILWDRGKPKDNHVAIYASPGKCFDFGSKDRVKAPQPGNKSLVDSSAVAGRKVWRIIAKGSSNQTNTTA